MSCLLKAEAIPSFADKTSMSELEIIGAVKVIQEYIEGFKYDTFLKEIFNKDELVKLYLAESVDYFKLQIFRIIIGIESLRTKISDPILKYIDEQFHIENDYVFYLDYSKYNTVPSFVLPKCTEFLKKEKVI